MTHYTILTIKQQILSLILQFINSVNGDGSKTAKKSLKRSYRITQHHVDIQAFVWLNILCYTLLLRHVYISYFVFA